MSEYDEQPSDQDVRRFNGELRTMLGAKDAELSRLRSDLEGARALASKLADALKPFAALDIECEEGSQAWDSMVLGARAALSEARGLLGKGETNKSLAALLDAEREKQRGWSAEVVAERDAALAARDAEIARTSKRVLVLGAALLELGHHSEGQPCEGGWGYDYGKPCPGCVALSAQPSEDAPKGEDRCGCGHSRYFHRDDGPCECNCECGGFVLAVSPVEHPEPACWDCGEVYAPGCAPSAEARPEETAPYSETEWEAVMAERNVGARIMVEQIRKAIESGAGRFADEDANWIVDRAREARPEEPKPTPPPPTLGHEFVGGPWDSHNGARGLCCQGMPVLLCCQPRSAHVAEPRENP